MRKHLKTQQACCQGRSSNLWRSSEVKEQQISIFLRLSRWIILLMHGARPFYRYILNPREYWFNAHRCLFRTILVWSADSIFSFPVPGAVPQESIQGSTYEEKIALRWREPLQTYGIIKQYEVSPDSFKLQHSSSTEHRRMSFSTLA